MRKRGGLRLLCGFVTLLIAGYLVEIFLMGAPSFTRGKRKSFDRRLDPIEFWTQFTLFAAAGVAAGYATLRWNKVWPLVEEVDENDRKRIEALGPTNARWVYRWRSFQMVIYAFLAVVIVAMLLTIVF